MKFIPKRVIITLKKIPQLCSILLVMLASCLYANEQEFDISIATAQLPPYVYLDENNEVKGLFVDILDRAQQTSSFKINLFVMPWGRALSEVKANRLDAVMPALWSEERESFLVYPKRTFYALKNSVLIKRVDDSFIFTGLDSISPDKTIGKARLVLVDLEFDQLVKQGKLSIYQTTKLDEALLMLNQKKIDFVASDKGIALSTIQKLGLDNQFTFYELTKNVPSSYIAFSRAFSQRHDIDQIMDIILEQIPANLHPSTN